MSFQQTRRLKKREGERQREREYLKAKVVLRRVASVAVEYWKVTFWVY